MFQRNKLTLTASIMEVLEKIRLTVEVFLGEKVVIKEIELDLKTKEGHGKVKIGREKEETLLFRANIELNFAFGLGSHGRTQKGRMLPCIATFHNYTEKGEVRVLDMDDERTADGTMPWQVGRSATDRWEEKEHLRGMPL
jgi:hypothetical protein